MSVRMNFMPVFAGAGLKRSLTPSPVKSPIPEYSTILEIVFVGCSNFISSLFLWNIQNLNVRLQLT
jgi:hypothetical protein